VLRVLAWLGKIRVKVLDERVGAAMSQLPSEAGVAVLFGVFLFQGAFIAIVILVSHPHAPFRRAGRIKLINSSSVSRNISSRKRNTVSLPRIYVPFWGTWGKSMKQILIIGALLFSMAAWAQQTTPAESGSSTTHSHGKGHHKKPHKHHKQA
jgi:hypothetical protein